MAFVLLGRLAAVVAQQPPQRPGSFDVRVWDFPDTPAGPQRALALVPRGLPPGARLPLLIALHGWGESTRGVSRGAWGWARDYELGASDHALRQSPLRAGAFLGNVSARRFAALRADLARRPYGGLVVVTPYTPDLMRDESLPRRVPYAEYLLRVLLPRARAELPVLPGREATGIDGVSLGGLVALEVGLGHPEEFGAVGALQPAVLNRVPRVMGWYVPSPTRPPQRVRLVTSVGDPFRGPVRQLSLALRNRGVDHDVRLLQGPHDYIFNRGPGGVEMLLFHDRALRGLPAE